MTDPTALALFALDPAGFGGVVLRGPASPPRDRWLAGLAALTPIQPRRLPGTIDDARLLGGLDVAATLAAGRPVTSGGLLAEADGGVIVVPMAERLGEGLAGRLAGVLDTHVVVVEREGAGGRAAARVALVLLDEGADDDEGVPDALAERVAFLVDPEGEAPPPAPADVAAARARLADVAAPDADALAALCATAQALGVDSARAALFALRAARASAAWSARPVIAEADLALAARLVLAPRATRLPPPPERQGDAPSPPEPQANDNDQGEGEDDAAVADTLSEIVLAAARAALPANLLTGGRARTRRRGGESAGGRGAGERRVSLRRGRPAGVRPGMPGGGTRLALAATLTQAAVWQRARGATPGGRIVVRKDDLRLKRFETRAEATVVVVVDASGSAALARLAEAKGAVELLLAQAYVLRTQVALIAFRGTGAELLLPPTRSLTRARRALAELAGGGGTPLAAGLDAALALALGIRRRGRTPRLVLLTDGRGNVPRDGTSGRAQAVADASDAARALAAQGIDSLLIDTAPRPRAETRAFADSMAARYLALPRVDAGALAAAVAA